MQTILTIIQMILGVLMIIAIMLQNSNAGLGAAFGGAGGVETTRRGSDLFFHRATIVLSLLFFAVSLALLVL